MTDATNAALSADAPKTEERDRKRKRMPQNSDMRETHERWRDKHPLTYLRGSCSAPTGTRTQDLRLKRPLLYQLSYRSDGPPGTACAQFSSETEKPRGEGAIIAPT